MNRGWIRLGVPVAENKCHYNYLFGGELSPDHKNKGGLDYGGPNHEKKKRFYVG